MSERIYIDPSDDQPYIRFQGAGYSMPVTFDEAGNAIPDTTSALLTALADPESAVYQAVAAIGGGGGGFPFPMAEGVWYDQSHGYAVSGDELNASADNLYLCPYLIPVDCTITKLGIYPASTPVTSTSVVVAVYEMDASGLPAAQVGTEATVSVPDSWDEETIVESGSAIEVTAGWYFLGVAVSAGITFNAVLPYQAFFGTPWQYENNDPHPGYVAGITDVHLSMPATLVSSEDVAISEDAQPRIFFQITHAT